MMLTEIMALGAYEKTYTQEGVIEHVKYYHVIEKDGNVIQKRPHRIVLDRDALDVEHTMPDGTTKSTADIITELGSR